tara:strand:- start:491 stop:1735 length:1245 start_codon:yes stop_codon:yes gene_type:complete
MARPNVTVVIDDQSYVIPNGEEGSIVRGGMVSTTGLILAVGNTAERQKGIMEINSVGDWMQRLTAKDPTGNGNSADFYKGQLSLATTYHGDFYAGGSGGRYPQGPTGAWKNEWYAAHNFLQYGGTLVVGATGSVENTGNGVTTLQNKSVPLDLVFAATGDGGNASSVAAVRGDCVAVVPDNHVGSKISSNTVVSGSTSNEFTICVFGAKRHLDVTRGVGGAASDVSYITTNCAADVAGCIARNDRLADPWISPAGFRRGQILDVVSLVHNPSDAEMDTLYDSKINPIVTFPGEGTVLFGDKTLADGTSTLSRINVSRLFIYLKKTIGAAARGKLFEINDATTRASFVNAVSPLLRNIQARRGIYDFRVVCDETNNTAALIDSNHFIADIFIKPAKSINYIRITFTNKNTADDLG